MLVDYTFDYTVDYTSAFVLIVLSKQEKEKMRLMIIRLMNTFVVILNVDINTFFLKASQLLFLKVFWSFLGFVRFVIWGKKTIN